MSYEHEDEDGLFDSDDDEEVPAPPPEDETPPPTSRKFISLIHHMNILII